MYGRFSTVVRASSAKGAQTTFNLSGADLSDPHYDIWKQWTAIQYVADADPKWMTSGGGGLDMFKINQSHKEPESGPNAFHYLTLEWTPDRIEFDINGEKVRTLEGEEVTKLTEP